MKIVYNKNDEKRIESIDVNQTIKNRFTAGGDSTYWAIHTDNK